MYHLANTDPDNVARSLGRAAKMRPDGVVSIMFRVPITPEEIQAMQLDCSYMADGTAFFSEGITSGAVVDGHLLVMLPIKGVTPGSYRPCHIKLASVRQLTVDGVGMPTWDEEQLALRSFHYRCRKELRRAAKELAHA